MFSYAKWVNPDVSKWNTSNVTNMSYMFTGATKANPDVSNWEVSCIEYMSDMFKDSGIRRADLSKWILNEELLGDKVWSKYLFTGCSKLEYLKTPAGLKTDISVPGDVNFKIVRVEKGKPVAVIDGNKNLKDKYIINQNKEKNVSYHIYRKDEFAGVTFDSNDGNSEAWVNHEIVEKRKSIKESGGNLPAENPKLAGDEFLGWTMEKDVVSSEFDENTKVNEDTMVYALWKNKQKVKITFENNSGSGSMDAAQVDKGSKYNLPTCKFTAPDGKEFDKWSVAIGSAATEGKMPGDEIVASDNVTVKAVWKANAVPPVPNKVKVTFEASGGTGSMAEDQVDKDSNYVLPACGFTAPECKVFDKWTVIVGTAAPVEKAAGDTVVASDNVTVKAQWKENVTPPPAPGKTRVTLDGNGGVLAGGAEANIDIESGDTIKTQLESAVVNKIFTKPGYKFIGFSRSKFATAADYNLESPVYTDMTLYAVYVEAPVFTDVTIKYDIFDMENVVIENVAEGKPIGSKLDGHVKQRDGFRFLGFAKTQDATKPDFFKKSIVTNNLVLYPVYKEIGTVDKVKVAFKLNDGTDASLKTEEVIRYESLGDKMPTKDSVPERDGYLFTGWAKSKAAKYPDFFRGTTVKGDMTVYAVWKSLYDEKLGQAVLKVAAKVKGYELTIEPPKANLHTGFEIFRSEKKDFKPSKDNKIATIDRNTLKYLDEKADNGKAYYYAVRAIDADGSYNGTKVTYIGKLSDKVLAAPLPKDKGVTATVAGKGAVDLEFNKTMAAAGYKVTVTAPYDKKFKTIERFVEADKLVAATAGKVKASVTGLPTGKFLAFKLEALEADNNKLVEYGNSFAFMMGAVEKLTAKVNKKSRVLNVKFKAMKGVNGYEAKIVIGGKVKTVKLKKGKKKLRGFIVGSIKLPKKKGNYTFTIRAFKKIGKLKYFGQTITKVVR